MFDKPTLSPNLTLLKPLRVSCLHLLLFLPRPVSAAAQIRGEKPVFEPQHKTALMVLDHVAFSDTPLSAKC